MGGTAGGVAVPESGSKTVSCQLYARHCGPDGRSFDLEPSWAMFPNIACYQAPGVRLRISPCSVDAEVLFDSMSLGSKFSRQFQEVSQAPRMSNVSVAIEASSMTCEEGTTTTSCGPKGAFLLSGITTLNADY